MLIPYRVKNPPKKFPYATLTIVAVNVIVYGCTTQYFLAIRENVARDYSYLFGTSPFLHFFSSSFLHGDIFHIAGNMLFLWIFGPPVEDRLGIPKYVGLYFLTGFVGDVLQAGLDTVFAGVMPTIGASGCIMGVVGAYWYLFPWSTVCVFYWLWWCWHGVTEIAAVWIIGLFLLMDLGEGFLYGAAGVSGGVANFAHVGGGIAGILLCIALRARRDTEALSEAKALHADAKDLYNMPLHALKTMAAEDPCNPELIRAMINPALRLRDHAAIEEALTRAGYGMIDKDPGLIAYYLMELGGDPGIYPPMYLLRLASAMERANDCEKAVGVYRMISERYPTVPECETALYRMALCCWKRMNDAATARTCVAELQKRFPNGEMYSYGEMLLRQM